MKSLHLIFLFALIIPVIGISESPYDYFLNKSLFDPKQLADYRYGPVIEPPNTNNKKDSSSGSSITSIYNLPSPSNNNLDYITKTFPHINTDKYLINKEFSVLVRIISISEKNLDDLKIKEIVGPSLRVNNSSIMYIKFNPLSEKLENDRSKWNKVEYNDNNLSEFTISIPTVHPNDWIFYNYNVSSSSEGVQELNTIVGSKDQKLTDYCFNEVELIKNIPIFQISVNPIKNNALVNEALSLKYSIRYIGDDADLLKFSVKLDNDSKRNFNVLENNQQNISTQRNDIQIYSCRIKFPDPGTYIIPGLVINGELYETDEPHTITIQDWMGLHQINLLMYFQIIGLGIQILALIWAFKQGKKQFEVLEKNIESGVTEIKRLRKELRNKKF